MWGLSLYFLCLGIESVFSKISCDVTTVTDMLGGHAGVTNNTVLQYLGIVEQRTNELLQLQAFIHAKVVHSSVWFGVIGHRFHCTLLPHAQVQRGLSNRSCRTATKRTHSLLKPCISPPTLTCFRHFGTFLFRCRVTVHETIIMH